MRFDVSRLRRVRLVRGSRPGRPSPFRCLDVSFRLSAFGVSAFLLASASAAPPIPDDFPRFIVPGHDAEMATLRQLYHLHYQPPAGPLATMWDEWMPGPTLWPAVTTGDRINGLRQAWSGALSTRIMEPDGYVATHQHPSIAHPHGWPFPFWAQGGPGTWGWHFAIPGLPPTWHATQEKDQKGWQLTGGIDRGIADHAWNIEFNAAGATAQTPPLNILPDQAPFMQLRWRAKGLERAQPFLEWTTQDNPEYGPDRRFYFPPATDPKNIIYTVIPVFESPTWKGTITRLRINFDNPPAGASAGIQGLFTQYDTRHSINNVVFVRGCCEYFYWTRDLNFLRDNIQRMRTSLLYAMTELGGRQHKCIVVPWVGHDGRPGFTVGPDGKKTLHSGHGIGHNYWDIMPMGQKDSYATIRYYEALSRLADLEDDIAAHPEWNIPGGPLRQSPADLRRHAEEVKAVAGKLFWNAQTGRFGCGIDADGKSYDYGHVFLNCDAVYYRFATDEQARSILAWLTGERTVEGDTSTGEDIYRFKFGPRATTRRNIDYYLWSWNAPESIPFGGQVQDGGAVLGWAYHDMMARLKYLGPDNAWQRLRETIHWFDEIQAAGGYREYYKDGTRGSLQGGGTPGGLGCDQEFFESILVPQVVLDGFLGFRPRCDGFEVNPRLPKDWPAITVTRIAFQRLVLSITASSKEIILHAAANHAEPVRVYPPPGTWRIEPIGNDGKSGEPTKAVIAKPGESASISFAKNLSVRLARESP